MVGSMKAFFLSSIPCHASAGTEILWTFIVICMVDIRDNLMSTELKHREGTDHFFAQLVP